MKSLFKATLIVSFLVGAFLYIRWASGPHTTYKVEYHESSITQEITLEEYSKLVHNTYHIDEPYSLYVDDSLTHEVNN